MEREDLLDPEKVREVRRLVAYANFHSYRYWSFGEVYGLLEDEELLQHMRENNFEYLDADEVIRRMREKEARG